MSMPSPDAGPEGGHHADLERIGCRHDPGGQQHGTAQGNLLHVVHRFLLGVSVQP